MSWPSLPFESILCVLSFFCPGQAELWYPCSIICCGFDSEDSRSASLLQASYDVSDYSVSFLRDFVGNRSLIPDSGLFDCLSSLASYGFLVIREARKLRWFESLLQLSTHCTRSLVSSTPWVRGLRPTIVCLVSIDPWVVPNQFKLPLPAAVIEGSVLRPMICSGKLELVDLRREWKKL